MAMEEDRNIGLALGLASYGDQNLLDHRHRSSSDHHHQHQKTNNKSLKFDHVLPSLSLGLVEAGSSSCQSVLPSAAKIEDKGEARSNLDHELCRQNSSISPGSSYSNDSSTVKKEKDGGGDYGGEEGEVEKGWSRPVTAVNSDEDEEGSPRKKLRLTKEQAAVLEDSFKEHSTLNPNQKQALAKRLNLRPRQVEVWFQNRRARTKLKQTEMDCELLKKYCQTLREENKRLQKELQELKALKLPAAVPSPVYMQVPAATLSMCPSCERIISSSAALVNDGSTTTRARGPAALTIYSKQASQLCNPFSHPSAAC